MSVASQHPLLAVRQAAFHYGTRAVLEAIHLTLDEATATALIGPNGAGKTTLLRLIAGTLQPTSGDVFLEGRSLATLNARERARLVALVPQQLDVPFDFTVQQIVEQGRTPYLGLLRGLLPPDHPRRRPRHRPHRPHPASPTNLQRALRR